MCVYSGCPGHVDTAYCVYYRYQSSVSERSERAIHLFLMTVSRPARVRTRGTQTEAAAEPYHSAGPTQQTENPTETYTHGDDATAARSESRPTVRALGAHMHFKYKYRPLLLRYKMIYTCQPGHY